MKIPVSDKKFDPAPEGLFQAVCVDFIDRGMLPDKFSGDMKHKADIVFELEEKNPATGKPFRTMKRFNLTLAERSNLRKFLEAWRGKRFTDEALKEFDTDSLLGVNCQLQITHNVDGEGRVRDSISAIIPVRGDMVLLRPSPDYIRHQDRDGNTQPEPF